jgi:hypothetical protein
MPPSASITEPVMKFASSEARNSASAAIAAGMPGRPIGWKESIVSQTGAQLTLTGARQRFLEATAANQFSVPRIVFSVQHEERLTMAERNYWVMRTDHNRRGYIRDEIAQGRLRQGWGYAEEQDLNLIAEELGRNGWRVGALSETERQAWRNQRMWPGHWGRINIGDLIIVPKMPTDRQWTIVEVTGDYRFEISSEWEDYGHVLPVEVVRDAVSNANRGVSSRLQRTMRNRGRLWSITAYAADVDELLALDSPIDRPDSSLERLQDVMSDSLEFMRQRMADKFGGNENEDPVHRLLERLYAPDTVERRSGPHERGADFEITRVDPLGVSFTTVVQLKTFQGLIDDLHALDQIALAVEQYQADAGVILTTADDETDEFRQARESLAEQLNVKVYLVAGDELARLFLGSLGDLVKTD